jgi:hypothetical protein
MKGSSRKVKEFTIPLLCADKTDSDCVYNTPVSLSTDGNNPPGLTPASDGNFYGWAGLLQFRITPAGQFTSFNSLVLANPRIVIQSDFVQGADGKLYGVACHYELHQDVLFEVGLDGSNLQTFSSFEPFHLGFHATLLSASDGNLWEGTLNTSPDTPGSIPALSP